MSRWRTELASRWRRLRGPLPRYVLYLQDEGVWSWRDNPETRAKPPLPDCFDNFTDWCRAHSGAQARLLLAGSQVHNLVVDPSLGLKGNAAVRDYARQQFAHYHGIGARSWPLAVWTDGAHGIASAAPSLDIANMQASALAHSVGIRGMKPVWCAGMDSLSARVLAFSRPGTCELALVESALVTWVRTESGRICGLEQRHLDAPQAELLVELIAASSRTQAPDSRIVVGWGLQDPENTGTLPARVMGNLGEPAAFGPWVLDAMGGPP